MPRYETILEGDYGGTFYRATKSGDSVNIGFKYRHSPNWKVITKIPFADFVFFKERYLVDEQDPISRGNFILTVILFRQEYEQQQAKTQDRQEHSQEVGQDFICENQARQ